MPSHCCVVGCTQRGYTTKGDQKVSFFNFPKERTKRKQWIHAIRREEGKEFFITAKTKVCSLHFKPKDLRKTLTGCLHPLENALPSVFYWSVSPEKRKLPMERLPLPTKNETRATEMAQSSTSCDYFEDCEIPQDISELLTKVTKEQLNEANRLNEELKQNGAILED